MSFAENQPLGGIVNVAGKNNNDIYYYSILPVDFIIKNGLVNEAIVGQFLENPTNMNNESKVDSFRQNPKFVTLMQTLVGNLASQSPSLIKEAKQQKEGWVYIIDKRIGNVNGKVLPQDIIGGFKVEEGKPLQYSSNPNHVLLTEKGVFKLEPELEQALISLVRSKY